MNVRNSSMSPDGRYQVNTAAWEARMSHWIETPWITDTQADKRVLSFSDSHWSLDKSAWLDNSTVELVMRKYPGNHKPVDITVTVDLARLSARVGDKPVDGLHELERVMNSALEYY